MNYPEKLEQIRKQMKADNVSAYIVPSADPHISEYLPHHYKCIPFLSGFTGSAGTLVITEDFAGLWADFRYFEQATEQLANSGFQLVKQKVQHAPEYIQWLTERLPAGATIASNEKLVSLFLGEQFTHEFSIKGISLADKDYISSIWTDRPPLPKEKAFLISAEAAGQSVIQKLSAVRERLENTGATTHLISSLDDIAWLFNLRGKDVSYNPVVLAFAIIDQDHAKLFIDEEKLDNDEKEQLLHDGVEVLDYSEIEEALTNIHKNSIVLIDPKRNCFAYAKRLPVSARILKETNPSTNLKAIKNETEVANTKAAMLKDGVAITKFLKWLSENIGSLQINELSAAEELKKYRAQQGGFVGNSFTTISAYKAHGALPHYGASEESNAEVKAEGLFLVDSGGQYLYGTTDITRTIPMGNNTEEESIDYTLVLKGMIDGCSTRFPKGTNGYQIDAITRKPLWDHARNYGHGTGHGVGYFLNVHEGPQVFNPTPTPVAIEVGMITSIEPGIYRPGKHGIRIENLVNTITDVTNEFNEFYAFECLTIAPISTKIVKKELLETAQINWLNNYNQMVLDKLSPLLSTDEQDWLRKETSAI
jgi:Xaa-Pro aminopeptidase